MSISRISIAALVMGMVFLLTGLVVSVIAFQQTTLPDIAFAQGEPEACSSIDNLRDFQEPTPAPLQPTATPDPDPEPTEVPPTPRPAPSEDRVGFPEGYQEDFKLLFVFDRPDNRQVRVICGNDAAASREPGEAFPYGSVLIMETWRVLLDADGNPLLDENGNYIRGGLTGVFVQRKEEGFGEAYEEDRSGEWEYVAYRPNGDTFIPPSNTNACAACHLNQAGEDADFVFRMDLYHNPDEGFMHPTIEDNEVSIFIYEFMPMEITVPAGTTVTWINNDETSHTVTAVDESFDSGELRSSLVEDPDASFSVTFDEPGTYEYFCSIHPRMTGVIVVTE
ncbi:MAG: cytochrome P460 family protein [Chloroflexi bacterium]|nr:cytochrome P460 family protein [Chloroflexota bacterium]